ncbi:membrane protein insertase YidC [Flavisphingomonas formosensis]|uniref:membrane protein insertase YidC n=1 Tax=Flavisphingomonas formosensis TaxID=861534 RepID=UPI0012F89749|nr:membrane protein insertase YidC [Sphingomonas formosensis]
MDNNRNVILAIFLSALVVIGWMLLAPRFLPTANPPATKIVDGKQLPVAPPGAPAPEVVRDVAVALNDGPRVAIDTPRLKGSINLKGARIDDLLLVSHRETIAKDSPPVRLLAPSGTKDAYFASFGWTGDGVALPASDTLWKADGNVLTPAKPVTLSWANPAGQIFAIRIAIDANYMFSITQSMSNASASAIAIKPYSLISRVGISKDPDTWTMHTGPIGAFGGAANYSVNFKDVDAAGAGGVRFNDGDWLGFGDKYWLTALVPANQGQAASGFRAFEGNRYQADISGAPAIVAPGKVLSTSTRLFAGAKEVNALREYEKGGIIQFDRAIDWGWFYWFEQPIFWLLDTIFKVTGNFGVAIILLTLIVRGAMFPVAQRQFASMAGMRAIQPKMKALQERHKDDKATLQKEMLALYQKEKVNPVAGCLPMFIQIPIFYALYKVLMLTIEMRHQPFILWIKDLSAPDPLTPLNLFGLLNFTPPGFLHLGVLAILLGITMYLQFKLNPTPMDESQKQVFAIMPWVFMFIMAPFAAGLQLYWVVSNLLTIGQQKLLYSRHPALKEAQAK